MAAERSWRYRASRRIPDRQRPSLKQQNRNRKILFDTYLAYRGALTRMLRARLGNEQDAEDLVQELYLRLQRSAEPEVREPAAYLYKMALNLARDHQRERLRSKARDRQWVEATQTELGGEPVVGGTPADLAYGAKQRLERLMAALEELSPHCRRVFTLHKFEGLAHAEIAARLGIGRSTVEKHMTTALKHLTRRLDRD